MPLKDLSGKTVFELDREDFEKLFCWRCQEHGECHQDDRKLLDCRALVNRGLWDKSYRKD